MYLIWQFNSNIELKIPFEDLNTQNLQYNILYSEFGSQNNFEETRYCIQTLFIKP